LDTLPKITTSDARCQYSPFRRWRCGSPYVCQRRMIATADRKMRSVCDPAGRPFPIVTLVTTEPDWAFMVKGGSKSRAGKVLLGDNPCTPHFTGKRLLLATHRLPGCSVSLRSSKYFCRAFRALRIRAVSPTRDAAIAITPRARRPDSLASSGRRRGCPIGRRACMLCAFRKASRSSVDC
jgi:hypothetical protein